MEIPAPAGGDRETELYAGRRAFVGSWGKISEDIPTKWVGAEGYTLIDPNSIPTPSCEKGHTLSPLQHIHELKVVD